MSGIKVLLLCGAISFLIGALIPVFVTEGSVRNINWISLGLSFVTFAFFLKGG